MRVRLVVFLSPTQTGGQPLLLSKTRYLRLLQDRLVEQSEPDTYVCTRTRMVCNTIRIRIHTYTLVDIIRVQVCLCGFAYTLAHNAVQGLLLVLQELRNSRNPWFTGGGGILCTSNTVRRASRPARSRRTEPRPKQERGGGGGRFKRMPMLGKQLCQCTCTRMHVCYCCILLYPYLQEQLSIQRGYGKVEVAYDVEDGRGSDLVARRCASQNQRKQPPPAHEEPSHEEHTEEHAQVSKEQRSRATLGGHGRWWGAVTGCWFGIRRCCWR